MRYLGYVVLVGVLYVVALNTTLTVSSFVSADTATSVVTLAEGQVVDTGILSDELVTAGLLDPNDPAQTIRRSGQTLTVICKSGVTLAQVQSAIAAHDGKDPEDRLIDQLQAADDSWATLTNPQKDQVLRKLLKLAVKRLRKGQR